MDETETLLQALSEAGGIPGYEDGVRALLCSYLTGLAEIERDRLGSVIFRQQGTSAAPRVMIAAHMDEIGFIVSQLGKRGCIRVVHNGVWLDYVLPAQRVAIRTSQGDVEGVFGARPPHLVSMGERGKPDSARDMYVDIGATSAEEVRAAGVRPGDPVVPISTFRVLHGGNTYLGKAWDDRAGCAALVEVVRKLGCEVHPNTVYAVGTVQEEVGCRGARTSAQQIAPDVAIVLEVDFAGDVPGIKEADSNIRLGQGPSVLLLETGLVPHVRLRRLVLQVAEEAGIPLQFSAWVRGSTDGATIHLVNSGVPTIALAVPCRHVHTHAGIIHRADYDNLVRLLTGLVKRLDGETVSRLTE